MKDISDRIDDKDPHMRIQDLAEQHARQIMDQLKKRFQCP